MIIWLKLFTVFQTNNKSEISQANKEEAEYHKNCGNEFMKNQNNEKAIEAYSKYVEWIWFILKCIVKGNVMCVFKVITVPKYGR